MFVNRSVQRFTFAVAVAGLLALVVSGCGGTSPAPCVQGTIGCAVTNNGQSGEVISAAPATSRGACTANPSSGGAHPRWTFLVYMNSANNLQPYSFANVAQMASVGSDNNVNIVLQWKQVPAVEVQNQALTSTYTPSFVGTHRYFIKAHNATDVANIAAGNTSSLEDAGERLPDPTTNAPEFYPPGSGDPVDIPNTNTQATTSDMGNVYTLQNFIKWGTTTYPADNLAVVIWDHGSGWLNVYRPNQYQPSVSRSTMKVTAPFTHAIKQVVSRAVSQTTSRAVSQDDEFYDEIETWELPEGLSVAAQKIDDLIFDCSLQQMIEIEYQVRSNARVMVGSEESPPATGYPYDKILLDLKASGQNPCDVGKSVVTEFCNDYTGQTGITQSYIDLSQLSATVAALDAFGVSCYNHRNDQGTVLGGARTNALAFGQSEGPGLYDGFLDLYNYAQIVQTTTTAADLKTSATNLMTAISNPTTGAVLQYGRGASDEVNSNGISAYVYIYADPYNPTFPTTYSNLAISTAAPNWTKFIENQSQ